MARLNEPPVSTDNLDIIRRKLLRQNRDLARANSTHLLRIRTLEAQNAQLMSDKLTLEGRIIALEQQPEPDSEAHRIADHAIDMRTQLEARLLQCVEMLGELGTAPPRKRHSNARQRRESTAARISLNRRSPAARRIRPFETQEEAEARAKAEGRLTPIAEKRDWTSRRTMDQNEIMALCSAADTTDSPELGPPPMSRFVDIDTDPVKTSPSRAQPTNKQLSVDVKFEAPASPVSPAPTKMITPVKSGAATKEPDDASQVETEISSPTPIKKQNAPEVAKTSSKRKFGSNDVLNTTTSSAAVSTAPRPRSTIRTEGKNTKTLKELASIRREAKDSLTAPITTARKPLSNKSTNEDVTSPKKSSKPASKDDLIKPDSGLDGARKGKAKPKAKDSEAPDIVVPLAPLVSSKPTVDVMPTTKSAMIEPALMSPRSPEPTPPISMARDTPPPADISSKGETARPGRRARAAVSYAEPNLRDKMRRPTKELCDAVTGEGRARSRMSTSRADEPASADQAIVKREPVSNESWKHLAAAIPTTSEALEKPGAASPLAKKASVAADISTRSSEGAETPKKQVSKKEAGSRSNKNSPLASPTTDSSVDPYEFTTSTPSGEVNTAQDDSDKPGTRRLSRSNRRLSSVVREDFAYEPTETVLKDKTNTATRKRASMAHARPEMNKMSDDSPDTSGSADSQDAPSRASMRRRSMML
ncbi:Shugoshin like protein [Verticillium longisporum]|nr:Shugoshin like protein [Verticillium longisporum]